MGTTEHLIQGPGNLYVAPMGTANPADTSVGSAPTGGWVDVGFTVGGLTITYTPTYVELAVDQEVDVVERRLTKREFSFGTTLAEATLANLQIALNNDAAPTTGAGFSKITPEASSTVVLPTYRKYLFDGIAPGVDKTRRVIINKGLQVDAVSLNYSKENQTVFALTIAANKPTSGPVWEIIDEA